MPKKISLFIKYALIFGALTGSSLLISGLLAINFSYQESKQAIIRLQREKAEAAAMRIGQYLFDIEQKIGVTAKPEPGVSALENRSIEIRFLKRSAAINEMTLLDRNGKEYLRLSRRTPDAILSGKDFSATEYFLKAKSGRPYRSPIYFRNSAPYITVAMAVGAEEAGVTVAEIDLEFLLDGITRIKVGESGLAYAVNSDGLLIAHPDIGLVLKQTSFSELPQVKAAIGRENREIFLGQSIKGDTVLTAFGTIPQLGWYVFVEEPLVEAYRPLYMQIIRSAALVLAGMLLTLVACMAVVRRMVKPIHALQEGATLIGSGVLDHHIVVTTGDELEELANEFNRMAEQLQKSYTTLESKVAERTAELLISHKQLQMELDEKLRVEKALQVSEKSYRGLFENAPVGIFHSTPQGRIINANPAIAKILGYASPEELITAISDMSQQLYVNPDIRAQIVEALIRTDGWVHYEEIIWRRKNNSLITVDMTGRKVLDSNGSVACLEGFIVDITERKQAEDELRKAKAVADSLSLTDSLTRVANRRRFDEILSKEFARLARSGLELSLIMLDIDCFKAFNDTYGHVKGDECLKQIASVIADCTNRAADLCARYGGEEFACILPETDLNGALLIAEQIRQGIFNLAIPHERSDVAAFVTASLGVASIRCKTDKCAIELVVKADELLYKAKSSGRNRVVHKSDAYSASG